MIKILTLSFIICFFSFLYSDLSVFYDDEINDAIYIEVIPESFDINKVAYSDLEVLNFLDEDDITAILSYIKENQIKKSSDLVKIGLSPQKSELLSHYIIYPEKEKVSGSSGNFLRYKSATDEFKNSNHINMHYCNYELKIQKDFSDNSVSSYPPVGMSLTHQGKKHRLILGQYRINHSLGLLFSNKQFIAVKPGFNTVFTKSAYSVSAVARESNHRNFTGFAYQQRLKEDYELLVYSSYKPVGARIKDGKIERLLLDDPLPKETVNYFNSGIIALYKKKNLNTSVLLNVFSFDKDFTEIYSNNFSLSFANSVDIKKLRFFSETAYSNSNFAGIYGASYTIKRFSQVLSYREISPEYYSEYSNFLSEFSHNSNERGFFYKIDYSCLDYKIQLFADVFENIDPMERYSDTRRGSSAGIKYQNLKFIKFDISFRQKDDYEWRLFEEFSRLYERKREYFNIKWIQEESRNFSSHLNYHLNRREYPEIGKSDKSYVISQSILLKIQKYTKRLIVGFYDNDYPVYYYAYSGRLNNSLFVLSGEGYFYVMHIEYRLSPKFRVEAMNSLVSGKENARVYSLNFNYIF